MYFNPPLSQRSDEALILIAYGSSEDWQKEAMQLALEILDQRKVDLAYRQSVIENYQSKFNHQKELFKRKLASNEVKKYHPFEQFLIFFLSIFIICKVVPFGLSLSELKDENYKLKYKQRLISLLLGVLTWMVFLYFSVNIEAEKRDKAFKEEMDKIDISEWEKNHPH